MWAAVGFDTCVNSLMCLHFSWFTATRNSIIFHASILYCTMISKLLAYVKIRKTEKFFRCHAYGCLSLHFLGFGSIIFGLLDLIYSGFHEKFVPPWAESSFTADVSCATEMGYSLEQVRNNGVEDKKMRPFPVWMRPLPPNERGATCDDIRCEFWCRQAKAGYSQRIPRSSLPAPKFAANVVTCSAPLSRQDAL